VSFPVGAWSSLITSLLGRCRPSTISRLVAAVVVYAIDRMKRRWASAHVGKKGIVRIAPTLADGDSASAVVAELLMRGQQAPLPQAAPRCVLWRDACRGAVSVFCLPLAFRHLAANTPATARLSSRQCVSKHNARLAAIASAFPSRTAAGDVGSRNNSEPTGSVSALEQNRFRHGWKPRPYARWLVAHCWNHQQVWASAILS
jgi:hypothetical protein